MTARSGLVHEDGRFFLLTTPRRFDLITGEPPPPKIAGIASLYSREYFNLMRDRLNEGGMATYWLPVHFDEFEDLSVVRGFCDAFPDCSLWSDPVVAARLEEAGLESPAQLGALFRADGETLAGWVGDVPPLVDDHPHRLSPKDVALESSPRHFEWMGVRRAGDGESRRMGAARRATAGIAVARGSAHAQYAADAPSLVPGHEQRGAADRGPAGRLGRRDPGDGGAARPRRVGAAWRATTPVRNGCSRGPGRWSAIRPRFPRTGAGCRSGSP